MNVEQLLARRDISDGAKITYQIILVRQANGQAIRHEDVMEAANLPRRTYFNHIQELRKAKLLTPGGLEVQSASKSAYHGLLSAKTDTKTSYPRSYISSNSNRSRPRGLSAKNDTPGEELDFLEKKALELASRYKLTIGRGISKNDMDHAWELARRAKVSTGDLRSLALLGRLRFKYRERHSNGKNKYNYDIGCNLTGREMYLAMASLVSKYKADMVVKCMDTYFSDTKHLRQWPRRGLGWFFNEPWFNHWLVPLTIGEELNKKHEGPKYRGSTRGRLVVRNGKEVIQR